MTTWASERHPPIPGYELIRVLGQNDAIVYVARSARFDKPLALQVWSDRTLPVNVAAMVGLEHPNILGILDVGEVIVESHVPQLSGNALARHDLVEMIRHSSWSPRYSAGAS
jgi:hypothetical protein